MTGASSVMLAAQVEKLLQTVADKHGRIDGVANCIGTVELTKPPHITSEAEFRTTMDNNVLTAFNIVKGTVGALLHCICAKELIKDCVSMWTVGCYSQKIGWSLT